MVNHANPHPVDPIVKQLLIIRESRGIKQARIATKMGSTQTSVSEMERGHVDSRISRVRGYAAVLDLGLYLGNAGMFPDVERYSVQDLIDLYHLVGEELKHRLTPAETEGMPARAA